MIKRYSKTPTARRDAAPSDGAVGTNPRRAATGRPAQRPVLDGKRR